MAQTSLNPIACIVRLQGVSPDDVLQFIITANLDCMCGIDGRYYFRNREDARMLARKFGGVLDNPCD